MTRIAMVFKMMKAFHRPGRGWKMPRRQVSQDKKHGLIGPTSEP
jgi:hypothetical protein